MLKQTQEEGDITECVKCLLNRKRKNEHQKTEFKTNKMHVCPWAKKRVDDVVA